MATNAKLITLTLLNATAQGSVVNQYDTTKTCLTDKEIINKSKLLQNTFVVTSGERVMANDAVFFLLDHNFLSTEVSIKMCFWVELYMFFVLHDF